LNSLFLQEAEDVIEDKVAVRLLGKEEGLDEFAPGSTFICHLANDLNDDTVICTRLSVDRVDIDFAIVETKGSDLVMDFLRTI